MFKSGKEAEHTLALTLVQLGIPSPAIFRDLYIKKRGNEFSQLDIVAVTKVGILVIEVKDYSGWIFGNGKHTHWTQVLAQGKQKYRFYNPIIQNHSHLTALQKKIKQNIPFYSIIVFYGNCELKEISKIPPGTFVTKSTQIPALIKNILKKNKPVKYNDRNEIIKILKEGAKNGTDKRIQKQHIKNVRNIVNK